MSVIHVNLSDIKRRSAHSDAPDQADCELGHGCQFCPREPDCKLDKPRHEKLLIEARLERIDQIVLVMANKGGVGKSTVSANLAAGLAARGYRVGVADADVHGPNQSRFFGFAGAHVRVTEQGLQTRDFEAASLACPIKVGSLAFLMERDDAPIVWRDAYKHDFMHHLIGSFDWGELDFLLIDMPPGTGNELITLSDMLESTNVSALLVTTPQEVALMDSLKAVRFCQERKLPLLGAVENMSGITCPHCSGEFHLFPREAFAQRLAETGVQSLTRIPLDPELARGSDEGMPDILARPEGAVAVAFHPVIEACIGRASASFAQAAVHSLNDAFSQNLESPILEQVLESVAGEQRDAMRQTLEDMLVLEQQRLSGKDMDNT
ncbi:MAG: chromosome partitioning protein ParA [Candidimonas sp.]|nr:MAG: chromosome partitioning protein ParA [Candidimonas sp.]TAM21907.1 MAG: chromosome partitioning protein ParA [Candidimonas sp.]